MIKFDIFLDSAEPVYEWCQDNIGDENFCSSFEGALHTTTRIRPRCSFWIIGEENITAFKLMWAERIIIQRDI